MSRINKKHLTSAILLAAFIALLLTQIVRANPILITSISPTSGPVGTLVTVTGEADTPGGLVRAYFDVDGDGIIDPEEFRGSNIASETAPYAFTVFILVPPSTAGTHAIIVNDADAGTSTGSDFTVTPQITVSPTSGPIGTEITVAGAGFDRASAVTITFKGIDVTPSQAPVTDEVGSFTTSFLAPPTIAGDHLITATDEALNSASSSFTLLEVTVSIDPTSGSVGTLAAVTGTQATPNGLVTIWWDDATVDSVTALQDGTYSSDFTVPASTAGEHTVTAEDTESTNTASQSFTVEPRIVLSMTEGSVGTELSATGTGFAGDAFVDINFDTTLMVDDLSTDSTGGFTANFAVPASVAGSHTVTATDTIDPTITASTPFTVIPKITIDVTEGPIGTEVEVTGTGFAGTSTITLTFDGIDVTPDPAPETDEFGSFTASFETPPAPAGDYTVTAIDGADNEATAAFTLWRITVSIDPTSGPVDIVVTITGNYATPEGSVAIRWDNIDITTITAEPDGTYSYYLTVPPSVTGDHTITVEDVESTNTATQTFTVEPQIILTPEDGAVGDSVTVTGTGFSGGTQVAVYFDIDKDGVPDEEELMLDDVPTDEFGSFESSFSVPWVSTAGNYLITAVDGEGVTDDAVFTVLFVMYTRSGEYFQGDYPSFFIDAAEKTGDPMEGAEVIVSVYDPAGYLQYKGITVTFEDGTVPYDMQFFNWWMLDQMGSFELTPLHLPSDATVGTWTWTAVADGLTVNGSFEVTEPVDLRTLLDKLDQLLEGQQDVADLIVYYVEKLQLDHEGLAELITAVSDKLQMNHEELVALINQVAQQLQLDHEDIIQLITSLSEDLQLRLDNLSTLLTEVADKLQLDHQELITLIGDVTDELKLDHQALADLVNNVFDALEIKLDDIKTEISGITEKVDGLYLVIGNLEVKLDDINAKVVNIQGSIATVSTTLGEIQVKLTDIQAQLVEIKDGIATVNTMLGQVEVKLDDIEAKLLEVQGNLATVATDIGTIKTDISDINGKLTSVEDRLATIETDIGSIQVDIADINGGITSIDGRLTDITTAIGTIQTDISAINGRLTSVEGNIATITTDIGTINTDISNINGKIVDIEGGMATIETDIGEIKTDLEDIQARLVQINGAIATVDTAVGRVETKVDNLGAVSLEEIKENIATIMTDIGTIKTTVSTINANITSIKGRLVTIETTVGTIQEDISEINGKIVALEGDTATIQTDIGTIKTNLTGINTKIEVTNGNIATIQTDIGTIKGRLATVEGDVATIETDIGTVKTCTENIEATGESIKSDTGLQPATVGLSLIAAIGAIAAAAMVLRKVYLK